MRDHEPDLAYARALDGADVWEPWRPQIGECVRVRLSGECRIESVGCDAPTFDHSVLRRHLASGASGNQWSTTSVSPHDAAVDGASGVILAVNRTIEGGHYYRVWFDAPVGFEGWAAEDFAACELIPLSDHEAPAQAGPAPAAGAHGDDGGQG